MFDYTRRYAADLAKQIGIYSQNNKPTSDTEKKAQAKLEMQAEVDPKVWAEIADMVNTMLDAAGVTGTLDKTIAQMKDFAKLKQREFEDKTEVEESVKQRQKDKLTLSTEVQVLTQTQPAPAA